MNNKFFRQIYRNILKILPNKVVLNIENLRGYHKFVNFKNPRYFGEKIQCLKLSEKLEKYSKYVDKYEVRNYVKEKVGKEYLIPLLGVYEKTEDIEYEKFPKQYVLKINNGSGYNYIVTDSEKINRKKINKKLDKWKKEKYYKIKKEAQYKNVKSKILVEKFLQDQNSKLLDYKFFCFNGKIEFIEVDFDRFSNHTMNFYDTEWKLMNLSKGNYNQYKGTCPAPKNFEKMKEIAIKLSQEFNFVRVDLYNVDGKIYFGELTFTPASGLTPFKPLEKDIEYAKLIEI